MNPRKLKRVVIKEELVALTGCFKQAIILNQLMYWSERVRDFDKLIAEEQAREPDAAALEFRHGWIYKTSEELAAETMLGLSKSNMRTHIKRLVAAGWVAERRNPRVKLDHTLQYRVNFVKLRQDLLAIGYDLHGYVFDEFNGGGPGDSKRDTESRNETSRAESKQQYHRLHRDYINMSDGLDAGAREETSIPIGQEVTPDYPNLGKRENEAPPNTHNFFNSEGNISANMSERADISTSAVSQKSDERAYTSATDHILDALHAALSSITLNNTAITLADHFFADIYAMLERSYAGRLEPEIIRMAAEIYIEKQTDERTARAKFDVYNPVGWFHDAYGDALRKWKAVRYRREMKAAGG